VSWAHAQCCAPTPAKAYWTKGHFLVYCHHLHQINYIQCPNSGMIVLLDSNALSHQQFSLLASLPVFLRHRLQWMLSATTIRCSSLSFSFSCLPSDSSQPPSLAIAPTAKYEEQRFAIRLAVLLVRLGRVHRQLDTHMARRDNHQTLGLLVAVSDDATLREVMDSAPHDQLRAVGRGGATFACNIGSSCQALI
jgi:hypothetical protein